MEYNLKVRVVNGVANIVLDNGTLVPLTQAPVATSIPGTETRINTDRPKQIINAADNATVSRIAHRETISTANTDPFARILADITATYIRPLRLEKTLKVRKESLHEFLIKFFTKYNNDRATVYADTAERVKDIQTEPGKRRSFGDIFKICQYYYPNITVQELFEELFMFLPDDIDPGFRTSYCHKIKKRVYYYDPNKENRVADENMPDEYGYTYDWYIDNIA